MYCMDLKEWIGNLPRRLVYIVPVLRLARVAKQNMLWAAQISLLVVNCQDCAGLEQWLVAWFGWIEFLVGGASCGLYLQLLNTAGGC